MLSLLVVAAQGAPVAPAPSLKSLEYSHLSASALRQPPHPNAGPPPHFFTSKQDNFDDSNEKTWQQAYYVNDQYFDGSGPVFLCVGGEGPALDGTAVTGSVHCNVAVEFLPEAKALMFAVEHRYYGCHNMSACPYSESDKNPFKWLSSRQALADLATFHAHATKEYSLSAANKWVSCA
jgi:serine protease 16